MADDTAKLHAPMDRLIDRVMQGETPLQVMAREGAGAPTAMRSIERFPYYTAFPYGWYRAATSDEVPAGKIRSVRYLGRDLIVWRGADGAAHAFFISVNTPIDFEYTEVSFNYKVRWLGDTPELRERTRRVGEALVRDLRRQEEEDIVIFDHKIHHPRPRLSPADGPIAEFRRWAAQFYVAGDPRAVNA